MPFIAAEELPKMELFPGALSGIVAGEGLMLSFLEMAEGSEVPEHSHPHEQAGLVLSGGIVIQNRFRGKTPKNRGGIHYPAKRGAFRRCGEGPRTRPRYLHPATGGLYRQVQ